MGELFNFLAVVVPQAASTIASSGTPHIEENSIRCDSFCEAGRKELLLKVSMRVLRKQPHLRAPVQAT